MKALLYVGSIHYWDTSLVAPLSDPLLFHTREYLDMGENLVVAMYTLEFLYSGDPSEVAVWGLHRSYMGIPP